jgi:hypothetical protein
MVARWHDHIALAGSRVPNGDSERWDLGVYAGVMPSAS